MSEIFNQTSEVSSLSKMIEKDFTLQGSECLIPSVDLNSLEEFKKYLTAKLSYLLDNKYDVLINTLYRIDVDENKLNELFSGKNKVNIPEVLAELIIARQLLKVRFRQKHNEGKF